MSISTKGDIGKVPYILDLFFSHKVLSMAMNIETKFYKVILKWYLYKQ